MDGSAVSIKEQVEATIAAIGMPAALVAARAKIGEADRRAEELLREIRVLTGAAENSMKEGELGRLRIARVKALDAASKARLAAAPLLKEHRDRIAAALAPKIDALVSQAMAVLDETAERLEPICAAHRLLVREAVLRGATAFALPAPNPMPDGLSALLENLSKYHVARSREAAAAGGRRRVFGKAR